MSFQHLDVDYLAESRHFHLSSLFLHKGLEADLPDLFRELKRRGLTISLDSNDDPDDQWNGVLSELLPLIDILLPNERELLRIARKPTLDRALAALSSIVPLIAVNRGPRGCLLQIYGARIEVPSAPITPVDTIGAGDSFNAGFRSAWVEGASPLNRRYSGQHRRSALCPARRRPQPSE